MIETISDHADTLGKCEEEYVSLELDLATSEDDPDFRRWALTDAIQLADRIDEEKNHLEGLMSDIAEMIGRYTTLGWSVEKLIRDEG